MQKKMGIRLRHLQAPPQPARNQNIMTIQNSYDQTRKRQRSPSPLNRRKIFPKPNNQYDNAQFQQIPQHHAHRKFNNEVSRPSTNMVSPIMNQPFNSNNNSMIDGSNQYQSEVERLIESLKKKTIELQKKDQTISRLKRQIELIKAQNGSYIQQIKTLKAQLQFQRISRPKNNQFQLQQNQKINKATNGYNQTQNKFQQSAPNFYQNAGNKQLYQNQPYQQFAMPAERDQGSNSIKANFARNMLKQEQIKPKRNKFEEVQRQQDSVLSDYLSPLMVFKTDSGSKPYSSAYSRSQKNPTPPKSVKANSRIQYNIPTKFLQSQKFVSNTDTFDQPIQSPFSKKNGTQEFFTQGRSSLGNQNIKNAYEPPGINNKRNFNEGNRWPTLESSAAHFNTNFVDENYPYTNFKNQEKNKKELAIQDSRQFRFEDFDFSELDHSMSNSAF